MQIYSRHGCKKENWKKTAYSLGLLSVFVLVAIPVYGLSLAMYPAMNAYQRKKWGRNKNLDFV